MGRKLISESENHRPPIGQPLRSCRPTLAYTDTMTEHKGQI